MDSNSSFETDSPSTKNRKRFQLDAGKVTEKELAFKIRNGLLELGDDGEYHEMATFCSDGDSTDEEVENMEPMELAGSKFHAVLGSTNAFFNKSVDESLGSLNPKLNSEGRKSQSRVLSPLVTNSPVTLKVGNSMSLFSTTDQIIEISTTKESSGQSTPKEQQVSNLSEISELHECSTQTLQATPQSFSNNAVTVSGYNANGIPGEKIFSVSSLKQNLEEDNTRIPETVSCTGMINKAQPELDTDSPVAIGTIVGTEGAVVAESGSLEYIYSSGGVHMSCVEESRTSADGMSETAGFHPVIKIPDCSNKGTEDEIVVYRTIAPHKVGRSSNLITFDQPDEIRNENAVVDTAEDSLPHTDSLHLSASNENTLPFSSPEVTSSPFSANTPRLPFEVFRTPASYLSPASINRLNKTVELMDISYRDVAEEIAANCSDASFKDLIGLTVDHPVEISENQIEVPSNVHIIDEILDLSGDERVLFVDNGRPRASTANNVAHKFNNADADANVEEGLVPLSEILESNEERVDVDEPYKAEEVIEDDSKRDTKGIEEMSPASVAEDMSLNNTSTNSFGDISLDEISNDSFHVDSGDEEDRHAPNDSFRTCESAASTASFTSCQEVVLEDEKPGDEGRSSVDLINEEVKSFEDLDDTMTMVEKLLLKADELEEREAKGIADESPEAKSPLSYLMNSAHSTKNELIVDASHSPSIFATPKTPHKSRSPMGVFFATPAGPAPKTKYTVESHYFSPAPKPALPPTPPRTTTTSPKKMASPKGAPSSSPSPKSTTRKLNNILDSPVRKVPKDQSPHASKTPSRGHPITSPVANYIYSMPPPVQVKKMNPPPKLPVSTSPSKSRIGDTRIPRPKLSTPMTNAQPSEETIALKKPGRETINGLFPRCTSSKELAQNVNYIGPDNVKSVNGSFGTTSKLPTPTSGITPVSQKHLGVRDSANASMVSQEPVVRKFCPESASPRK